MDDDGLHEELYGGRMLPQHGEGKRVYPQDFESHDHLRHVKRRAEVAEAIVGFCQGIRAR